MNPFKGLSKRLKTMYEVHGNRTPLEQPQTTLNPSTPPQNQHNTYTVTQMCKNCSKMQWKVDNANSAIQELRSKHVSDVKDRDEELEKHRENQHKDRSEWISHTISVNELQKGWKKLKTREDDLRKTQEEMKRKEVELEKKQKLSIKQSSHEACSKQRADDLQTIRQLKVAIQKAQQERDQANEIRRGHTVDYQHQLTTKDREISALIKQMGNESSLSNLEIGSLRKKNENLERSISRLNASHATKADTGDVSSPSEAHALRIPQSAKSITALEHEMQARESMRTTCRVNMRRYRLRAKMTHDHDLQLKLASRAVQEREQAAAHKLHLADLKIAEAQEKLDDATNRWHASLSASETLVPSVVQYTKSITTLKHERAARNAIRKSQKAKVRKSTFHGRLFENKQVEIAGRVVANYITSSSVAQKIRKAGDLAREQVEKLEHKIRGEAEQRVKEIVSQAKQAVADKEEKLRQAALELGAAQSAQTNLEHDRADPAPSSMITDADEIASMTRDFEEFREQMLQSQEKDKFIDHVYSTLMPLADRLTAVLYRPEDAGVIASAEEASNFVVLKTQILADGVIRLAQSQDFMLNGSQALQSND